MKAELGEATIRRLAVVDGGDVADDLLRDKAEVFAIPSVQSVRKRADSQPGRKGLCCPPGMKTPMALSDPDATLSV